MSIKILKCNDEYPLITSPTLIKELGSAGAMLLQKLYYLLTENGKKKHKKSKHFEIHKALLHKPSL